MSIYGPPPHDELPVPNAEEARADLAKARSFGLLSPRDRRAHAVVLIAEGCAFGLFLIGNRATAGRHEPWPTIALVAFVVAVSLLSNWQTRAKTRPRHLRVLEWSAVGATYVVMTVGLVVLRRTDATSSDVLLYGLVVLATATPLTLVGLSVLRTGRR